MNKREAWSQYIKYLRQWVADHDDMVYYGLSPMNFERWVENNDICIQH